MNEEVYTRNKSSASEKADAGNKPETGYSNKLHAGKLKDETSQSEARKAKFRKGKKKDSNTPKLKQSGSKTNKSGKRKVGVKPPIPSPPPPGSMNFTGQQYEDNNNASEDVRDAAGTAGIAIGALAKRYVGTYQGAEQKHDWSSAKQGHEIGNADVNRFRKVNESGAETNQSGSSYRGKMQRSKYAKDVSGTRLDKSAETEEGGSNPKSREWQKRKTQKEIMNRSNSTKTQSSGTVSNFFQSVGEKAEATIQKISEAFLIFVKKHPIIIAISGASFIGVASASSAFSTFGLMLSGGNNVVVASSFTAENKDIKAVEKDYQKLEKKLKKEIDGIEDEDGDYDEYRYNLADIEHDPIQLAALLTVLYEDYTEAEVKEELQTIFDTQYHLSQNRRVVRKTRTEKKWHWVIKTREEERTGYKWEHGGLVPYTYTVTVEYSELEEYDAEVEYDYKILNVVLTGRSIDSIAREWLNDDQLERYDLLLETKGNKAELFE